MPVIPTLGRLRQEDWKFKGKFQASLTKIARSYLKQQQQGKTKTEENKSDSIRDQSDFKVRSLSIYLK
jgi:hypothetical protein